MRSKLHPDFKEDDLLGENQRKEPMFYYVRIEEMAPADHLLRLVDKHVSFSFVREKVKQLYSHTGRPSVDPEILLRFFFIISSYLDTAVQKK